MSIIYFTYIDVVWPDCANFTNIVTYAQILTSLAQFKIDFRIQKATNVCICDAREKIYCPPNKSSNTLF